MVTRTVGTGLFILGLLGVLGTAFGDPRNRPSDPSLRVSDQVSSYVCWVGTMLVGVWLRRSGTPRPVQAPPRRDWDVDLEHHPQRAAAAGGRDTGSCAKCNYRPVAYDADYCPSCAAKNPNPGVVNRTVGKAVPLGGLACGLLGAAWGYFGMGDGGAGPAIAGLVLGGIAGVVLGLAGGLVAGGIARLSGAR
jgi:hypothetical protein